MSQERSKAEPFGPHVVYPVVSGNGIDVVGVSIGGELFAVVASLGDGRVVWAMRPRRRSTGQVRGELEQLLRAALAAK